MNVQHSNGTKTHLGPELPGDEARPIQERDEHHDRELTIRTRPERRLHERRRRPFYGLDRALRNALKATLPEEENCREENAEDEEGNDVCLTRSMPNKWRKRGRERTRCLPPVRSDLSVTQNKDDERKACSD